MVSRRTGRIGPVGKRLAAGPLTSTSVSLSVQVAGAALMPLLKLVGTRATLWSNERDYRVHLTHPVTAFFDPKRLGLWIDPFSLSLGGDERIKSLFERIRSSFARTGALVRAIWCFANPSQSGCSSAVCQAIWSVSFRMEAAMSDILAPLTIDFLAWLAAEPRDYVDVMDAWRTSFPRLTIWEDAIDAGLVTRCPRRAGNPSGSN